MYRYKTQCRSMCQYLEVGTMLFQQKINTRSRPVFETSTKREWQRDKYIVESASHEVYHKGNNESNMIQTSSIFHINSNRLLKSSECHATPIGNVQQQIVHWCSNYLVENIMVRLKCYYMTLKHLSRSRLAIQAHIL